MKKIIILSLSTLLLFLTACNFGIPEKIYLKLKSQYAFSIGDYEKKLSEYISIDSILDSLESSSSTVNFDIYDYNPNSSSPYQQYLMNFSFGEIPINISQYLEDMDFAKDISSISFDKDIEVPSLEMSSSPLTSINLPDINSKIRSSVSFTEMSVPVPASGSITPVSLLVPISGVTYSSIQFSAGYLNVKITPPSGISGSISLNLSIGSKSSSGTVSGSTETTIQIPLDGLTLGQTIPISVTGTSNTGSIGIYSLSFELSNDTEISKVTGLTLDLGDDGNININQTINMTTNEAFLNCVIGEGNIKVSSALPSGWSNITLNSDVALSGGISASNSDFTDNNDGSYLLNKELDLSGKTYTAGNIVASGTISISLSNSTIVLNSSNTVDLTLNCNISTVSSVTVNLSSIAEQLSIDVSESLPSGMQNYISYLILNSSGFTGTYTNELPEGNDITINTVSDFFGLGSTANPKSTTLASGKTNETFELLSSGTKTITPSSDTEIDFKININLPGATSQHPEYVTLSNIELGKTYNFSLKLTPVFDWDSLGLNPNAVSGMSDTIDTGFEVGTIFNQLTETLEDSTVVNKLEFTEIPLYLYALAPGISSFPIGMAFQGSLKGIVGTTEIPILPTDDEIEDGTTSATIPLSFSNSQLVFESDEIVTSDLEEDVENNNCTKTDLADIINARLDGTLKINYDLRLTGTGQNNEIVIKKEDLEGLDITSIQMLARMVVKLKLNVTDEITLDLLKLGDIESGTDIFDRTSATDYEDFEKYIDIINNISVIYTVDNGVFNYTDASKNVTIEMVSTNPEIEKTLSLGGGTLSLSIDEMKSILNTSCFAPTINMIAPRGTISIKRDAGIKMNAAIVMYADGQVLIN
ncbi:MAG: hypothetical protein K6F15_09960 [Treponema sp.]|nr:hypothetical protein [Treponema sp.]